MWDLGGRELLVFLGGLGLDFGKHMVDELHLLKGICHIRALGSFLNLTFLLGGEDRISPVRK